MKILTVLGTRPEAIKMSPVIKELEKCSSEINSLVCATAQHRDMLDQVLNNFEIRLDYDLDVMVPNQTLSEVSASILTRLDKIIANEQPDWVLVQGDTTSAMVASLVAYYHRARVGHVEAGLRSDDKWQPYPEEMNRRLTDVLTDLYFAPTEGNRKNLLREGVLHEAVIVTGNTVIDALLMTARRMKQDGGYGSQWTSDGRKLILVTAHRRENFGQPLVRICRAFAEIAANYSSHIHLVYPVHPNPNVVKPVREILSRIPNVTLTQPMEYFDFVRLISRAYLVLTDSGGLQEEAPSLGIPVLVLRDVTERPEGIAAGTAKLVGTASRNIVEETSALLDNREAYEKMARATNPYGDGRASERIVAALLGRPVEAFNCTTGSEHIKGS